MQRAPGRNGTRQTSVTFLELFKYLWRVSPFPPTGIGYLKKDWNFMLAPNFLGWPNRGHKCLEQRRPMWCICTRGKSLD